MRSMQATTNRSIAGFTLVEMLVIAPLVILFIGGFIGLLVALTGDSLKKHAQNISVYETQSALDDMEANAAKAIAFQTTTGTLQAKQGKDNSSGTAFTAVTSGSPDTLIVTAPATTKNVYDSGRSLVYTGSGTCDSSAPPYMYMLVYFVDSSNTLYKRTILPTDSTPCTTPYQQGSCSASVMASSPPTYCQVKDEKLLDNVTGPSIEYFDDSEDSSTADIGTSARITVQTNKTVAGQTVNYSGNLRVTLLNTPAPEAPVQQLSCNSGDTLNGSTCTHTYAASYQSGSGGYYYCPSGGTPSGSTCTYAATSSPSCPAGYTYNSTTNQCSYTYTCTTPGSCAGSCTTIGTTIRCTKTATPGTAYSCPNGGTLSGTSCSYTATWYSGSSGYYYCPSSSGGGTLNGTTCSYSYPAS